MNDKRWINIEDGNMIIYIREDSVRSFWTYKSDVKRARIVTEETTYETFLDIDELKKMIIGE